MSTGGASYLLSIERGGMDGMVVSPEFRAGRTARREDEPPKEQKAGGRRKKEKW